MSKDYLTFLNKNTKEVLQKISLDGLHKGEVESTIGLLAYENGLDEKDIVVTTKEG